MSSETLAGLLLIAAGAIWTVAFHCPTHWLVGYLVSIRFTDYFVGGPPPPRPGLKSDYASYLRADPGSRAWMHASGAIATKLAPFLALAFWPGSGAPWWSAVALIAIGVDHDRHRPHVVRERRATGRSSAASGRSRGPAIDELRATRRLYSSDVPPGSSGIPG